jgi:signal-transduction protein with cAMP-binding, CBS, and nucleotidyltransferase domain
VLQDVSVFEALGLMKEKVTGALLVSDKMERAVGIVSDRDCTQKIILDDKPAKQTSVSKIMNRDINGISMKNTIEECIMVMLDKNIRHLPFFDGSDVAGLISIGDTVKSIVKKQVLK